MKNLNLTYVIVNNFDSLSNFFSEDESLVSFDRELLDKKCVEMNKEFNSKLKLENIVKYKVLSLSEAVSKFHHDCIDNYTEHDASY